MWLANVEYGSGFGSALANKAGDGKEAMEVEVESSRTFDGIKSDKAPRNVALLINKPAINIFPSV